MGDDIRQQKNNPAIVPHNYTSTVVQDNHAVNTIQGEQATMNSTVAPGIVDQIARAKDGIHAAIADAIDRTNTTAAAVHIIQTAVGNITTDHNPNDSPSDTTWPQHIPLAKELQHNQDAMDTEIARIDHMSHLMTTLHHGIVSATIDLQQGMTSNEFNNAVHPFQRANLDDLLPGNPRPNHNNPSNSHTTEFILMISDLSQLDDDERIMQDMDTERQSTLQQALLQLELEEQRTHDYELS
jgi:hypothetical protein